MAQDGEGEARLLDPGGESKLFLQLGDDHTVIAPHMHAQGLHGGSLFWIMCCRSELEVCGILAV